MERIDQSKQERQGFEGEFHFKEVAEIEPALVSLITQLKEKIENGEYDTLLSDDVGGRIPSLVLRKIIKEIKPDKDIETYFIASGKTYLPLPSEKDKYGKLQEHLKTIADKTKKALVVTQFIFTGKTLIRLADALKEAGIDNFDMATVDAMPHFEDETLLRDRLGENHLYVGSEAWHHLHEEHENLSGVRKPKEYQPFPKRMADVTNVEGREFSLEEWKEIFGITKFDRFAEINAKVRDDENNKKYDKMAKVPLTTEETAEVQRNINFAREDVTLLANRVIEQVWRKGD